MSTDSDTIKRAGAAYDQVRDSVSSALKISHKMFVVLALIAACCIVMLTRDLTTAALVIGAICALMYAWADGAGDIDDGASDSTAAESLEAGPSGSTPLLPTADPADMYGPYYDMWHQNRAAYTDCYAKPRAPAVAMMTNDVDSGMAMIGIDRARDKKCIDGWVARDANYYKHHFGTEFEESEARIWWGRHEF